jgi:hypothetical protein
VDIVWVIEGLDFFPEKELVFRLLAKVTGNAAPEPERADGRA